MVCADGEITAAFCNIFYRITGKELHALFAIVVSYEFGEVRRKDAVANAFTRKDHGHLFSVHCESGGDFGANESSANHSKCLLFFGEGAKTAVIGDGAIVDNIVTGRNRESARGS